MTVAGDSTLAAVVVNYRSSALLEANIGPLSTSAVRLVIVDNYSDDLERHRLRVLASHWDCTLVELPTNAGFAAGVNAGVRAATEQGCEQFLLLNPDARVSVTTIEELQRQSCRDPLALISPQLLDPAGRVVFSGSLLDLRDGRIRRWPTEAGAMEPTAHLVPWLTAACLVVTHELWERVGGFAEEYFMYWEDVDFNYRCLAAGARLRLRTDLSATHEQGGTQGMRRGRAKSGLYYHFNCRNRLLFGIRHLNRRALVRWILLTPQVSWEILLQGGRRQFLHSPARVWSAATGAVSGLVRACVALRRRDHLILLRKRSI